MEGNFSFSTPSIDKFSILINLRQEAFMEHYFSAQRDNIFRNVEVLIYVFDVESREIDKDIHYYQSWFLFFVYIYSDKITISM